MPPTPQPPPSDDTYLALEFTPWWRRRAPLRIAGALALLGIALAAATPAALRAYHRHQAETLAVEAATLLSESRLTEAFDRTQRGLHRVPGDPQLLRLAARAQSAAGDPSCLETWQGILAQPWATVDDRLEFMEACLDLDQAHLVPSVLEPLLSVATPSPDVLVTATRYRLRANDPLGALLHTRALTRAEPPSPPHLLDAARLLDSRLEPATTNEARRLLYQVAAHSSASRLDAIDDLVNRPLASEADRRESLRLLSDPRGTGPELASLRARVLLADTRMRLDPAHAREIAVETVPLLNPTTEPDLLVTVRWLHRHAMFDLSLGLLPQARAQSSLELLRARLEAQLGTGQTAPAYREITRDLPAIDPLELELERYRLAQRLDEPDAARVRQENVLRLAGTRPRRLRRIAAFARTHALDELAIATWKRLAFDRLGAGHAHRALAGLTDTSGDTWAARDYTQRLAALRTNDLQLQIQIANYDVLLNENLPHALATAEKLLSRPEFRIQARVVAAYASLALDQRERARNHISLLNLPPLQLDPHLRALHTALLGAIGNEGDARALAGSIAPNLLRPEERELIRPYLSDAP